MTTDLIKDRIDSKPIASTEVLRSKCPLPKLMVKMGLAKYAKPSACSPLREDKSPSFGIFKRNGRWYWKDHGTDEGGDEIEFIAQYEELDSKKGFIKILQRWEIFAASEAVTPILMESPESARGGKPDRTGFGPGTDDQLKRLAAIRNIDLRGIIGAQDSGLLVFGRFAGGDAYGVTDSSGYALEVRRLDGKLFPAFGSLAERKSHAIKGSRKNCPVGTSDIGNRRVILWVEGTPDLLAAFEVLVLENALPSVAPVAMLSASSRIGAEALPFFKGCHIRIVPHADGPGMQAAKAWKAQLLAAGASIVDFVNVSGGIGVQRPSIHPIKDLNELLPTYRQELADSPVEGRILS